MGSDTADEGIEMEHAAIESQLGESICQVEDTTDMFLMRELDDYQSKVDLGNSLAAQYRFKEAVTAYEQALKIRKDDWKLWYSLSGARLTLRRFQTAEEGYQRCLSLGAPEKTVAYTLGISSYLKKQYQDAAGWMEKCLPCGEELQIAVIYWHTLSACRMGQEKTLLSQYRKEMQVGHHKAYQQAVAVFAGETSWQQVAEQLSARETSDLDYVIGMYGICVYLESLGEKEASLQYRNQVLERKKIWPCISYLAAFSDTCESWDLSFTN